jgi:hypothetical protein
LLCAVGSLGCLQSRVLRGWLFVITVHGRLGAVLDGLGNSLGTALIGHDGSPLAWSSNALAACRSAWCSMALAACNSVQRLLPGRSLRSSLCLILLIST